MKFRGYVAQFLVLSFHLILPYLIFALYLILSEDQQTYFLYLFTNYGLYILHEFIF